MTTCTYMYQKCTKLIQNTLFILFSQNKEQLCNGIPKLFVIYNNSPILTPPCVPMNITIVTNFQDFGKTYLHSMVPEHRKNFTRPLKTGK